MRVSSTSPPSLPVSTTISLTTSSGGNTQHRTTPLSLATTLKEHRDLVADYHHQLQQLQQQHREEQQHQHHKDDVGRVSRGSGRPSPPDSPIHEDHTSDMDEFMGSDNEDEEDEDEDATGVALNLVCSLYSDTKQYICHLSIATDTYIRGILFFSNLVNFLSRLYKL